MYTNFIYLYKKFLYMNFSQNIVYIKLKCPLLASICLSLDVDDYYEAGHKLINSGQADSSCGFEEGD